MSQANDVAIVSGQRLFREGMAELLRNGKPRRIHEVSDAEALLGAGNLPDLVLIDLADTVEQVPELVRAIRARAPRTSIVLVGTPLQQGAAGSEADAYLGLPETDAGALRSVAEFATRGRNAVRSLPHSEAIDHQRRLWATLSRRQREVLRFLSAGEDNTSIAKALGVSVRAIKAHVSHLLVIFGVRNRAQLALLALRAGLRNEEDTDVRSAAE